MKIFISSLITGMEAIRAACKEAIMHLGHEPVMAENFGARAQSPQVACLDGLRQSALVILILGKSYGAKQSSGLSATHEEYRDAKGRRPVIAFVQEDVDRDPDQAAFVREVQGWEGGLFRGGFTSPDQLRGLVTRAIHEWAISSATGPLDEADILRRALAVVPEQDRNYSDRLSLIVSLAGGPAHPILRPSEIEKETFADELMQAALFGPNRIFSPSAATHKSMVDDALVIRQDRGGQFQLDTQGGMIFSLALERGRSGPVVIEEDVIDAMNGVFHYAAWLLDKVDPTQILSHIVIVAALTGSDHLVWRTRAEQMASPNSYTMGMGYKEKTPVHLKPAHRPRAALSLNAPQIIEDLVTLLRREWKQQ